VRVARAVEGSELRRPRVEGELRTRGPSPVTRRCDGGVYEKRFAGSATRLDPRPRTRTAGSTRTRSLACGSSENDRVPDQPFLDACRRGFRRRNTRSPGAAHAGVRRSSTRLLRVVANRGVKRARRAAPPADPSGRLGDARLVPTLAGRAMGEALRLDETEALMRALNEQPAVTLRTNTRRTTRRAHRPAAKFSRRAWRCRPHTDQAWPREALVVSPGGAPGAWRGFTTEASRCRRGHRCWCAHLLAPRPVHDRRRVRGARPPRPPHMGQLMDDAGAYSSSTRSGAMRGRAARSALGHHDHRAARRTGGDTRG